MNKYKTVIVFVLVIVISLILNYKFLPLVIFLVYLFYFLIKQTDELKASKKQKETLQADFHLYLKNVILLLYTRPLRQSFVDANYIKNDYLKSRVDIFIERQKFDYTISPYVDLALEINDNQEFVNYELNIMQLLYETNKRGMGEEYINDLIKEIDLLIENKRALEIQVLENQSYVYTLPPTIINFVYVSFVLFKVIDNMIMSVLS